MTIFFIVLSAILAICCSAILYLYFKAKSEVNSNEILATMWHDRYLSMIDSRDMYMNEEGKAKSKICELENALYEKKRELKMLRSLIDERTINVRTFGTRTEYFNGSVDIPDELLRDGSICDTFDAPIFDLEIKDKLTKMLGNAVLKHTGFKMHYDLRHHTRQLIYICPIVVENKKCDNGEFIYLDQEAEMPMLDIIKKLYEKDKENNV